MQRKYEWAIGGVLTAAALSGESVDASATAGPARTTGTHRPPTTPASSPSSQTPSPSALAEIATGTPSPTTTATTPSPSSTLPPCVTTDLSPQVNLVTSSQASRYELMNIKLTNTSGHTCFVYGFPGLQLEDRNSAGQATNVVREFTVKPATLVVVNRASVATTARFDYDVPSADEPQTGGCEAASVYLSIIPPEEGRALSATIGGGPVTVCAHGTLDLLPFGAGAAWATQ